MGNSQSCVDCDKPVPTTVKNLDKVFESHCLGRRVYKFFTSKEWTLVDNENNDKKYLCQECLIKQSKRIRQEEETQQLKERQERERQCQIEQERLEEHRREEQQQHQLRYEQQQRRLENQQRLDQQCRLAYQQRIEQHRLIEQRRLEELEQHLWEEQQRIEERQRSFAIKQQHSKQLRRLRESQQLEEQHRQEEQQWAKLQQKNTWLTIPTIEQLEMFSLEQHQFIKAERNLLKEEKTLKKQSQLQTQQHFEQLKWLEQQSAFDSFEGQLLREQINFEKKMLLYRLNDIKVRRKAQAKWKKSVDTKIKLIEYLSQEVAYQNEQKVQIQSLLHEAQTQRQGEVRQTEDKRLLERQQHIFSKQHTEEQIINQRLLNRQREKRHTENILLTKPKIIQYTETVQLKLPPQNNNETRYLKHKQTITNQEQTALSFKYEIRPSKSNAQLIDEMFGVGNLNKNIYSWLNMITYKIESCGRNYNIPRNRINQTFNKYKKEIFDIPFNDLADCIFELCCVVMRVKQFWPRNTQILSLIILLNAYRSGKLLEIHTGEGKTCVIVMFSALIAMSGKYVDVISSSSVLAERDSQEWAEFYDILHIDVSCNLLQKENEDRLRCYKRHVVYGTVGSFASDILRHEFLMENVRGKRSFDIVVVDEVDCMLLDQGIHFTYLSHIVPGMCHLEPLLLMIWNEVIRHPAISSDSNKQFRIGAIEPFHILFSKLIGQPEKSDELLHMLYREHVIDENIKPNCRYYKNDRFYSPENFIISGEQIQRCMTFIERRFGVMFKQYIIYNRTKLKAVSCENRTISSATVPILIMEKGLVCMLYEEEKFLVELIARKLKCILFRKDSDPTSYSIPSHLSQFVHNRLNHWIDNAFIAINMCVGREYLIKDDNIVPIDFASTGVLEIDTKWGDCLHQFLEIKHGKSLSDITLVTNFMSNQTFFQRYSQCIFGVSGTLGCKQDEMYLQRTYDLDCKRIPTYCPKQFTQYPSLLLSNKTEWVNAIQQTIEKYIISSNSRAVLVVCEDINTTKKLRSVLSEKCTSITMFTRNDEDSKIVNRTFIKGDVILATNIAGRGTDIQIDKHVCRAGGLFVLLTFLPLNQRVEDQIFGRTARKGEPGSAQLILDRSSLHHYYSKLRNIDDIKDMRDKVEKQRIIEEETKVLQNVKCKEVLFSDYCSFLHNLKNKRNLHEIEKKIIYNSLHEYWGMWLKDHCDGRSKAKLNLRSLRIKLETDLQSAKTKAFQKNSPSANISHVVKFANEEMNRKNFKNAEKMFTRAITVDKDRAAVAYYNRALCRIQSYGVELLPNILHDLEKAAFSFEKFKQEVFLCLSLLDCSQKKGEGSDGNIIRKQMLTRCHVLQYLVENTSQIRKDIHNLAWNRKEIHADCKSIFMIALGDDKSCKKIDSELHTFLELGLLYVMTVKESSHFYWSIVLVAFVGVLKIAIGSVMAVFSNGILLKLGWTFITSGLKDIVRVVDAMYKGQPVNVHSWICEKSCEIVFSVTSLGFEYLVEELPLAKEIQNSLQPVNIFRNILQNSYDITRASLQSAETALKMKCEKVRNEIAYELNQSDGYVSTVIYSSVEPFLKKVGLPDLRNNARKHFSTRTFSSLLEDFISYWRYLGKDRYEINNIYWNTVKSLILAKDFTKFRPILIGFIKQKIPNIKLKMVESDRRIYNQCFPFFQLIAEYGCKPCSGKELVTEYCDFVKYEIVRVYRHKFQNLPGKNDEGLAFADATRCIIIDETVEFLYHMIKDALQYYCSEFAADRMNKTVENLASKNHELSKADVLEEILQLTQSTVLR